jgi:two-component system nitrogen regulation response regulator GlnG
VDVRVIAATNKPLEQAVAARQFREDLFYRLNVVRIQIPPLRERREDIRLLVNYFLKKFAQNQKSPPKSISPEAVALLENYNWPGNVRELENVIQRATVVGKGDVVLGSDLTPEIAAGRASSATVTPLPALSAAAANPVAVAAMPGSSEPRPLADIPSVAQALFQWARQNGKLKIIPSVERELIIQALNETKGNQVQAAKLLGITRATLRKRVEKFGIKQELSIS